MSEINRYHIYHFNGYGIFTSFVYGLPNEEISPGCFWIPYLVIQIILLIPHALFSYLKVSPDGIEYRSWPFIRYQIPWDEFDSIKGLKILRSFSFEHLVTKDPAVPSAGEQPKFIYISQRKIIPIYAFRGWTNGRLAHDLEQHIPEVLAAWHEQKRKS